MLNRYNSKDNKKTKNIDANIDYLMDLLLPCLKPRGLASEVQPKMAEKTIPVIAIETSIDPSEIYSFVFLLVKYKNNFDISKLSPNFRLTGFRYFLTMRSQQAFLNKVLCIG